MQTSVPGQRNEPRTAALSQPAVLRLAPMLLLALLSLVPRLLTLNDFFTEDESFHWVWRVQHFSDALANGNWAGTNLTGHPGITTLWLGTLGHWLATWQGVPLQGMAAGSANIAYLALLRLPVALVNGLAVLAGYAVLRRLVPASVALVAALLWAAEPFLVAHTRLLHLDGLVTSFFTLAVLLLLWSIQQARHTPGAGTIPLVLSGAVGGLALLTKAPSLLLLPIVGLLLLWLLPAATGVARVVAAIRSGLLWAAAAGVVVVLLYPAMWVTPLAAAGAVINEVLDNGAVPHHTGNYFLGQPVADPGGLFYPAVVLWRASPLLLLGLVLLAWQGRTLWATQRERVQHVILPIAATIGLFSLALSLAAKKFDRYLLPVWALLAILAAVGLVLAWQRLRAYPWLQRLAAGGALLLLLGQLLWYHPTYLAYFNPLVGGSQTGTHVLLTGWGEGMPQVGQWIAARPDAARSPVLTWGPRTLEPFVPGRTDFLNEQHVAAPASYAVLYIRAAQRQESLAAQHYITEATPPLHTVWLHGIEYARIYQPPRPYATARPTTFAERVALRGFTLAATDTTLTVTPSWNVLQDQPGGLFTFVHVLAPDGQRVAQIDAPLDEGLFAAWQAGQQFGSPLPLALPTGLDPTAAYRVVLGVYDPQSGARLPITQGTPLNAAINGAGVVELTSMTLPETP